MFNLTACEELASFYSALDIKGQQESVRDKDCDAESKSVDGCLNTTKLEGEELNWFLNQVRR